MPEDQTEARSIGTFDYVIAGARSVDCVLANRLSAVPRKPGLNGRSLSYPCGKVIGGCSGI